MNKKNPTLTDIKEILDAATGPVYFVEGYGTHTKTPMIQECGIMTPVDILALLAAKQELPRCVCLKTDHLVASVFNAASLLMACWPIEDAPSGASFLRDPSDLLNEFDMIPTSIPTTLVDIGDAEAEPLQFNMQEAIDEIARQILGNVLFKTDDTLDDDDEYVAKRPMPKPLDFDYLITTFGGGNYMPVFVRYVINGPMDSGNIQAPEYLGEFNDATAFVDALRYKYPATKHIHCMCCKHCRAVRRYIEVDEDIDDDDFVIVVCYS